MTDSQLPSDDEPGFAADTADEIERLEQLYQAPAADTSEIERPFNPGPRTKPRHGGSFVMAAMLGLAEALGWDPEPSEVTQPAAPSDDSGLDLDFGDLPPLEDQ